ncbi:MAG: hypothetical protein R3344_10755 [Acidobacteriota bacterium]|nr:hypothetical protein [Acidobacteriota bacterium]
MRKRSILAALFALAPVCAVADIPSGEARQKVYEAIARAPSISEQANTLALLAWIEDDVDPAVASEARTALVGFGGQGMHAIRAAFLKVDPDQQADVVRALLDARDTVEAGIPANLFPALEEAVWFGTTEARGIAIAELGRYRQSGAVVTIIDAGYEDDELVPVAIDALGAIGDDRARFFLETQIFGTEPGIPEKASIALARIGGRALEPLKKAMRSDDRRLRELAVRALLPVATVDDLSALYEYTYSNPEDDPELVEAVRRSTVVLERLLAAQQSEDSASPMPD